MASVFYPRPGIFTHMSGHFETSKYKANQRGRRLDTEKQFMMTETAHFSIYKPEVIQSPAMVNKSFKKN